MHLGFTATDHVAWFQSRQVLEPQASCLGFTMPKLPRLNDLMGGGNRAADDADRILDAPAINGRRHQQAHEIQRFRLLTLLAVEMPAAGHRQMRAWWMGNHQIPTVAEYLLDWPLQVPLRVALT